MGPFFPKRIAQLPVKQVKTVTRGCGIPSDKAIIFLPLNIDHFYAEFPAVKTEKELHDCTQRPSGRKILKDKEESLKSPNGGI